jgi:hypothetical protein
MHPSTMHLSMMRLSMMRLSMTRLSMMHLSMMRLASMQGIARAAFAPLFFPRSKPRAPTTRDDAMSRRTSSVRRR